MSKKAKIDWIDASEKVSLYTLIFENENLSEYAKFITKFKDDSKLNEAYLAILTAIKLIMRDGALERFFRPEGKYKDGVVALPTKPGSNLRLYCLRVSDKILFIGNGGIKETATYQENPELNGYVIDLQKFESVLKTALEEGIVKIEENRIEGFDNVVFTL